MKRKLIIAAITLTTLISIGSCKKYLDINSDPDTPQNPDASSVFVALLGNLPAGIQFDAVWIGRYIQFWNVNSANDDWDRHGYNGFTADRAGAIWRQTYFGLGKNINYVIDEGTKKQQWQYVGAAYAMKAHMFQQCTNYHGEIIFRDAFKEDSVFFKYDPQDVVYGGIDSLCRIAIDYLSRTDFNQGAALLSKGDFSTYAGDQLKWRRFAYGLLARNFSNLSNKASYQPDSVIKYCDLAMASGTDDLLLPFQASRNADANIFGTFRDNLGVVRQSRFIVELLDGKNLIGNTLPASRDPRLRHMLSSTIDSSNGNGGYRGVVPPSGDPGTGNTRVAALWGDGLFANPGAGDFGRPAGKYLFHNKTVMPVMTYAEMQFIKAEAAFRKGDRTTALTAYRNGIGAHFDFINRSGYPLANQPLFNLTPISAAERTAYLAGPAVKQTTATLTLTDIMLQKYIALWGWGFVETWCDLRRYHYTDIDANTGFPVYRNFPLPGAGSLFPDNLGRYAYRVRYRFNSEYVWNLNLPDSARVVDYHTKEMWFSKP
jgi:Starch-binding associating with outer membrane